MAKPIKTLELHYPMIQFLIIKVVKTAKTDRVETTTDNSSQTTETSQELKKEVFQKYVQVFTGLGRLEKPYHIEIDPTVSQL